MNADARDSTFPGDRLGAEMRRLLAHYEALAVPDDVVDCDWEHGICLCPCCGAVLRVVPRAHFTPHVVDADGRAHYCERYIAASFQRHGVDGMQPILDKHAARPVVDAPPDATPSPIWKRKRS